jgi:hypothetical protein
VDDDLIVDLTYRRAVLAEESAVACRERHRRCEAHGADSLTCVVGAGVDFPQGAMEARLGDKVAADAIEAERCRFRVGLDALENGAEEGRDPDTHDQDGALAARSVRLTHSGSD